MNRKKVYDVLIKLGIPANVKGFRYIADAILFLEEDKFRFGKIADLYREIALINGTTHIAVERTIRHSFATAFRHASDEDIDKYLCRHNKTNGNLLHLLYIRISEDY